MLERKIDNRLKAWKDTPGHKPLVVKGCRQCGKTYSVTRFAKANYDNVVSLNFYQNKNLVTAFDSSLEVDDIIMYLSAMLGKNAKFVPHKTCIIFDEIQQCPNARTALKFFAIDGRYDIIATGSLLGVSGYNEAQPMSVPVGYETVIDMCPLDFEEFLWANSVSDEVIDLLKNCYAGRKVVPEAIHLRMRDLLLQYIVVGGMPEVVNSFVEHKDMSVVHNLQQNIVNGYRDDMVKYAPNAFKPKIRDCFDSIPRQLSKEYKKFQYSLIRKGARADQYDGCIQWIQDAGIVNRCYNVSITELPLAGNSIPEQFKVYMADIGLLISMLEQGTQADVLQGSLLGYKGAIFENLMADILAKAGRKLYYFHKESGLEIDFLCRQEGQCVLVECKAKAGNTKSAKTVLTHPEKYHVSRCYKFGDYNVGVKGAVVTLPLYMAFIFAAQ